MPNVKQHVLRIIDQMPDDCSFEDIQHALYTLQVLQHRTEMADRGDFISQEAAEKRMEKWL